MRIPAEIEGWVLDVWPVGRLATLGAGGRPHQVPIVFARAGGALWSSIDGKPKREVLPVRVVNIRERPQVSLLLDHYDADWTQLWWLRVEGRAEVVSPSHAGAEDALQALRAKYPQYRETPLLGSFAHLIRIESRAIHSWRASESVPGPGC